MYHCVLLELREQLVGVYYFPHHVVQKGSNSGCQSWWQVPFPLEPSSQFNIRYLSFLKSISDSFYCIVFFKVNVRC